MSKKCLPHYAAGIIVKGFGRGSKELGIPTGNFVNNRQNITSLSITSSSIIISVFETFQLIIHLMWWNNCRMTLKMAFILDGQILTMVTCIKWWWALDGIRFSKIKKSQWWVGCLVYCPSIRCVGIIKDRIPPFFS